MNIEQTPHQERSREALDSQYVQEQLYLKSFVRKIRHDVYFQSKKLGIWQIEQWLKAKKEKELYGEAFCHSVTFDN